MELSTLTSKGQTTIPAVIRKELRLNSGDKLHFIVEGDHMLVIPAKRSIKDLKGIIPTPSKALSLDEMEKAIQAGFTQQTGE